MYIKTAKGWAPLLPPMAPAPQQQLDDEGIKRIFPLYKADHKPVYRELNDLLANVR